MNPTTILDPMLDRIREAKYLYQRQHKTEPSLCWLSAADFARFANWYGIYQSVASTPDHPSLTILRLWTTQSANVTVGHVVVGAFGVTTTVTVSPEDA